MKCNVFVYSKPYSCYSGNITVQKIKEGNWIYFEPKKLRLKAGCVGMYQLLRHMNLYYELRLMQGKHLLFFSCTSNMLQIQLR